MSAQTAPSDLNDMSVLSQTLTDLARRAGILDLLLASSRREQLTDDRVTVDVDAVAWHTAQAAGGDTAAALERARLTLVRLAVSERT
ncbi:MAG: hypothetical protein ACRDQZ_08430 [Mycobacteriales bacterium]